MRTDMLEGLERLFRVRLAVVLPMILTAIGLSGSHITVFAAHPGNRPHTPAVSTAFLSATGVTLAQLDRGVTGEGAVLYHIGHPSHPILIARIRNDAAHHLATAEIFQTPSNSYYVPFRRSGGHILIPSTLRPVVTMRAVGGWWQRHGMANWNLDVEVATPINAMWFDGLYINGLPPGSKMFHIVTRAGLDGFPRWDLRQVIPSFPGVGILRTNYAERKCGAPRTIVPGVSPGWPYVTTNSGYEQTSNTLQPPIVLNPDYGRVDFFKEIVGVRAQSCSFDLYSIEKLRPGIVNMPDFESPWGLYDLSGRRPGFPNLILRTDHYHAVDQWAVGIDPNALYGAPATAQASEDVRYSWADHPGNLSFDYKVDVFGFHPYTTTVHLAGGRLVAREPNYSAYPSWVIGQRWPAVTFVDATHSHEQSSEGIYAWTARGVGTAYWRGWTDSPDLRQFNSIDLGMRGEYRLKGMDRTVLYASPIDGRIHLLNAQGGLWSVGLTRRMLESNLTGGAYIDDWRTQVRRVSAGSKKQVRWLPDEELAAVGGYLLYAGHTTAIIRRAPYSMAAFRVLPPTNPGTWRRFGAMAAPYRRGKSASDLRSWLTPFPGSGLTIPHGAISDLRATSDGFRMTVRIPRSAHLAGRLPGLIFPSRWGNYVLSYHARLKRWSVIRATIPHLHISVDLKRRITAHYPGSLAITLRNTGSEDWHGTVTVSLQGRRFNARTIGVPGDGSVRDSVAWSPRRAGRVALDVRAGTATYSASLRIRNVPRPPPSTFLSVSVPSRGLYLDLGLLLFVLIGGSYAVWSRNYGDA